MSEELPRLRPSVFGGLPRLQAGFTTRRGGVSRGPYSSLNLGLSTGDAQENVEENRRRLGEAVGIPSDRFAIAGQVHGADVHIVRTPGLYPGYDGLVTDAGDLLLTITSADCAAVLFVDYEADVLGACHSGWRGTAAGISRGTIARMEELGASAARTRAYISPCISLENFEVGSEVAAQFEDRFVHTHKAWSRPHVDLKAAIKEQLRNSGVPEANIEVSPGCTMAATDDFYSYRAEDGTTGRMVGFIGLRSAKSLPS